MRRVVYLLFVLGLQFPIAAQAVAGSSIYAPGGSTPLVTCAGGSSAVQYDTSTHVWSCGTVGATVTRTAVSGNTTLSGFNLLADVTSLTANTTITLPAAQSGQRVQIVDSTGTAGSGSYLVAVAPNGSETIRLPSVGAAPRIYLSEDSAAFTLVGITGVGWAIESGRGYALDPRAISGLWLWLDARRGLTLTSGAVSGWADFSGNGRNVSQGTASRRPTPTMISGRPALHFYGTNTQHMTGASTSTAGGGISLYGTYTPGQNGSMSAGDRVVLFGMNSGGTTGTAFILKHEAAAFDWQQGDAIVTGNGVNSAVAPRFVGYLGVSSNAPILFNNMAQIVYSSRLGPSVAQSMINGRALTTRVALTGTVTANTNKTFVVCDEITAGSCNGYLYNLIVYDAALSDANNTLLNADLVRQVRGP